VIRYVLLESGWLASAGAIAGAIVAAVITRALRIAQPTQLPRVALDTWGVLLNWHIASFLLAVSTLTALGFGVAPAGRASTGDLSVALKSAASASGDPRQARTRTWLLVGQIAITSVLVLAAGLLIRSLVAIHRVDLGFNRDHVLTLKTAFTDERFETTGGAEAVIRNGLDRLSVLPGVSRVAVSLTGVPLERGGALRVDVVGRPMDRQYVESWDAVTPDYFEVLDISLVRGRAFDHRDTRGGPPVAIINQAMAQQLWPHGDPLSARIVIGRGGGPAFDEGVPRQVIGVVRDVRQVTVERAPYPNVYVPIAQLPDQGMAYFHRSGLATWLVRSDGSPAQAAAAAEEQVQRATSLPTARIRTMADIIAAVTARRAAEMWLVSAFGGVGVFLAVVGVYGIAAQSVQQRRREFGVRLALGADRSALRRMVLWQGLKVVALGAAVGFACALALGRALAAFLFGVTPHDAATFIVVAAILATTAIVGVWVPALRAAGVDPVESLRSE
jgi:predicted permease